MPTCTPQLCFGNTAPSYNGEADYSSYSLDPGEISIGKVTVSDTFVMFGRWTNPTLYYQNKAGFRIGDIEIIMRKLQNNAKTQNFEFLPDGEIDSQITEQITGGDPNEIEESIITEIRSKIKGFMNGAVLAEVANQVGYRVQSERTQFNLKDSQAKGYIETYMKIKTGRVKPPSYNNTTLEYPVNFVYDVKIKLSNVAFCKKVEDQFNLYGDSEPDVSSLDEKWQPFMQPTSEILEALCVCADLTLSAENVAVSELTDENFIPASEIPVYLDGIATPNIVIVPKSGAISSAGLQYLIQKAAERQNRGNMIAGIFGGGSIADKAFGWATTHLTANGPLVDGGISIPYLIDESGNITWDYHFYYSFGLTEAWALASNPSNYIQTVLTNAGILQEGGNDENVIQYLGGAATEEKTATNLNLNGTTSTPNTSRETGGGSPINNSGLGGNATARPGGLDSIRNRAQNIGALPGCWVALEVYGFDNIKWIKFADYLKYEAPNWFKNLYNNYGAKFAKFIKNKPYLKYFIRKLMDTKI